MDYRRANRSFMYMIMATLMLVVVLTLRYMVFHSDISILANNLLSEAVVLIPPLAAVLYSGEKISVLVPMHRIKTSSILLILVYVIALFPLVTLANAFSMLFVNNAVSSISDEVIAMPVGVMILTMGLVGPFVEEFVFRGIMLQSFQRTGRIIGSIVVSAVMFGMMHMNFNQFAYGAVMGVMLALLVEATGSVLSSFIAHAFFNSIEVVMLFTENDTIDEASEMAEGYLRDFGTVQGLLFFGYLIVAAAIFTTFAFFIVKKIAAIEGRKEFFDSIPACRKQGYKLVTIPLVIGMSLSVGYMFLTIMS